MVLKVSIEKAIHAVNVFYDGFASDGWGLFSDNWCIRNHSLCMGLLSPCFRGKPRPCFVMNAHTVRYGRIACALHSVQQQIKAPSTVHGLNAIYMSPISPFFTV